MPKPKVFLFSRDHTLGWVLFGIIVLCLTGVVVGFLGHRVLVRLGL